jgi:predicted phosphoribosyltransferase
MVAREADEVVCHTIPRQLLAVGYWYRDFTPVRDEEVLAMLARARVQDFGPEGLDTGS